MSDKSEGPGNLCWNEPYTKKLSRFVGCFFCVSIFITTCDASRSDNGASGHEIIKKCSLFGNKSKLNYEVSLTNPIPKLIAPL